MAEQALDPELTGPTMTGTEASWGPPVQVEHASSTEVFQGALARISILHTQEVAALQSQVLELRSRLKRLDVADEDPKQVAAGGPDPTKAASNGVVAQAGGASSAPHSGAGDWEATAFEMVDTGIEPHPCAKPHQLPPAFWQSKKRVGGPGERFAEGAVDEVDEKTQQLENNNTSEPPKQVADPAPRRSLGSAADPTRRRSLGSSGTRSSRDPRPPEVLAVQRDVIAQHLESLHKELEQCNPSAANRLKKSHVMGRRFSSHHLVVWSLPWFIEHRAFEILCAFIIMANSILVGANVVWHTTNDDKNAWIQGGSHFCSAFFLVELVLRLLALGCRRFFLGDGRGWNIFDFSLVISSIFDIILSAFIGDQGSQVAILNTGMKTIKIMRIVRVIRVFRFFKELSLLALMIVDSLKSLGWAIFLVMIFVYAFAILFTDNALDYIKEVGNNPLHEHYHMLPELNKWFGTLSLTTYTLIQSTLGGVSWGVVSDLLINYDTPMAFLFFFYQAFTILAVLNIITGVFVDNAVETAQTQREFLVQKEMELKEKYIGEMKNLFEEMDSDGNGTVTLEEIQEFLMDTRIMSYFQALGLDPNDTERLFRLIDDDNSGGISVDEFLAGCLRLKGQARSIDIHAMLHDLKKLFMRLEKFEHKVMGSRHSRQELDHQMTQELLGGGL